MKKLIRKGKVKEVYQVAPDTLEFHFTDNIVVFNKNIPDEVPRKGETLCKTSAYWFETAEDMGFNTHFIRKSDDDKMEVKKVQDIEKYGQMDKKSRSCIIPLEFISRYFLSDSLYDKLVEGTVSHEELGFEGHPDYGDRLPEPYIEIKSKVEDEKKELKKDEVLTLTGITKAEYQEIIEVILELDESIKKNAERNDLLHVIGKKEFAFDEEGRLMIVDSFGSVDQDIFWEMEDYKEGEFIPKHKKILKEYYQEIGYHDELKEARNSEEKEPPIPSLSDEMIEKISEYYVNIMKRLTDEKYGGKK